jgi:hypothetical protein
MKKLTDEISLEGKLEIISISRFRQSPGEVFSQVALGKVYVIMHKGRQCAVISKVPGVTLAMTVDRFGKVGFYL